LKSEFLYKRRGFGETMPDLSHVKTMQQ